MSGTQLCLYLARPRHRRAGATNQAEAQSRSIARIPDLKREGERVAAAAKPKNREDEMDNPTRSNPHGNEREAPMTRTVSPRAWRLLLAVYNGGRKTPGAMINIAIAGASAGLGEDDVAPACSYLCAAGLIAATSHPYFFTMTAEGVEAVENASLMLAGSYPGDALRSPAREATDAEAAARRPPACNAREPSHGQASWQDRAVLPLFHELLEILDRDGEAALDGAGREAVRTDIQSMRPQLRRANPNWIVIRGALAEMEPYIPAIPAAVDRYQKAAKLLGLLG